MRTYYRAGGFYLLAMFLGVTLSGCEDEEGGFSFSRGETRENLNYAMVADTFAPIDQLFRLSAGQGRSCFFRSDVFLGSASTQELDCWGRRLIGDYVNSLNRGENKMVVQGADHVCIIRSDTGGRRVGCAGDNAYGQSVAPEPRDNTQFDVTDAGNWKGHWSFNVQVIAAGNHHTCLLDRFGVHCWGRNHRSQTSVPELSNPVWVAAGGDTTCAIDGSQALHCWGDIGQDQVPSNLGAVSRVAVGADFVCAAANTAVTCWGNTTEWQVLPRQDYSDLQHLTAGRQHACVLDNVDINSDLEPHCFGVDNDDQTLLVVPDLLKRNIRTLSAGNDFTCASRTYEGFEYQNTTDHTAVECWGNNEENQTRSPKFLCVGFHDTRSRIDLNGDEVSDTDAAFCPADYPY